MLTRRSQKDKVMSTIKNHSLQSQPGTTARTNTRFFFRNRLSETIPTQSLPAESAPFWKGDWRLAIAEERVAMAEQRLARAEERFAKAIERIGS